MDGQIVVNVTWCEVTKISGPFQYKSPSYQYWRSHCGDKMVVRSSYLYRHNGILRRYDDIWSLYWNTTEISCCCCGYGIVDDGGGGGNGIESEQSLKQTAYWPVKLYAFPHARHHYVWCVSDPLKTQWLQYFKKYFLFIQVFQHRNHNKHALVSVTFSILTVMCTIINTLLNSKSWHQKPKSA